MEQQEVIDKLHRGELILMEYIWRKSTTEILLKILVKMRTLEKKKVGFQSNYEVLVTKKEYLSEDNNFFIRIFTTIHKRNNMLEEKLKKFIKNTVKR